MYKRIGLKGPIVVFLLVSVFVYSCIVITTHTNHTIFSTSTDILDSLIHGDATMVKVTAEEREIFLSELKTCVVRYAQEGLGEDDIDFESVYNCLRDAKLSRIQGHVPVSDPSDMGRFMVDNLTRTIKEKNVQIEDSKITVRAPAAQVSDLASELTTPKNETVESRKLKLITRLLAEPVTNKHDVSYVHNPVVCSNGSTEVLFIVPSASGHFNERNKVRNSGRAKFLKDDKNKAKMVFFLGTPPTTVNVTAYQLDVDKEAKKYGDIVQVNFEDVYTNIRLKAVAMLSWAISACPKVKFVIRTDDDVKVNAEKAVAAMKRTHKRYVDFILGLKQVGWEPIRIKENKYYISKEEYPFSTWPPFLLGGLLGYPMSTVKLLYQAALRVKPVWLDDVYLTGICAPKVGVPILTDQDFTFQHRVW